VTIANNGKEAVELAETTVFDAILMDIQMPEMDGYSATNAIRNKLKLHDLPVIAMTAHAMAGDKEKCINAGMNDYISKPIDSDLLYSKLIKFGAQNKNDSIDPKKIKTEKRQAKKALPINLPDFMPGIDIKSGISRFRGDTEIYIKLLADFINNYKNSIEKISTMIEGNRIKDVLNYLHGIKGIAGNLSLSALYKLSAELEIDIEKNAKADRTMLNNYEGAFLEASNTLNKIYELLNNSSAKQKNNFDSEFDPEDISEKINRLYEKILENDIEALDIFNVVKNLIQKRIPDDEIMILDKAINNFDFDEAKIVLFRIAEVFNITLKEM
ncbi:MAG: response regulator, partial [Desulfobacteraceae bacterium]|nr:response regulator [Desulfobacteraceae bacterium]